MSAARGSPVVQTTPLADGQHSSGADTAISAHAASLEQLVNRFRLVR